MKTSLRIFLTVLAASLWVGSPSEASELIYSQYSDGQSAFGPSLVWTANALNSELADDFDVVANIDRVYARAYLGGTVDFQGVWIRFYAFGADNKPGALQHEYFLAASDPNVVFNGGQIDATLSPVFAATGRHFLSVQPVIRYWYWWSSSSGAPRGQAFYFRDNTAGQAWQHGDGWNTNVNADLEFFLFGTVNSAGVISGLSESTLPRSGFLEIFGSNFGGNGTVLIGGISAPVADWTSTRVIAYVPESAPLSTLPVQVVSDAGGSNTVALSVTARPPAADHVNWRFRMDGPYSEVRAAIGPDQTVYAIDVFDHLYALAPDGGLKWLVRGAGDKGVAVGSDGTIYVASESFIKAFNPDGSAKWTFVQNPRAFICLGVSVGPDGNIYSVGTEGMGVFSLTPAGTLRWQTPEAYDRRIVDYAEILFGQNGSNQQLYFAANDHLRALRLDGSSVFTIAGWYGQPAVGPDGSVHSSTAAYSPNGNLLWFFNGGPFGGSSPADVGSDGVHYFDRLYALNIDGSLRWHATLNDYVGGPVVDPQNAKLILISQDTLDHAGFFLASSAQDGHELWRVVLPIEDPTVWNPTIGMFGFNQFPTTRARFTADGQTAYVLTATATGDNNTSKSFVYSLNAGNGTPPVPTSVVSRKTHGTAGTFDISLSLTGTPGVECRSGGANSDHEVVFTFASAVTLGGATITPQAGMSGSMSGAPVISPDGRTVTLHLTNITNGQTIAMTLSGVNSGTGPGSVTVQMGFLAGDTNADRTVNSGDVLQTRNRSGAATDSTNFRSDVNADSAVNSADTLFVRAHSGDFLP